MSSPLETVTAWLDAVNRGDAEGTIALSAPDIALVGPRGTARGHDALRGWLARAGATFETRGTATEGDTIVVTQRATWPDGSSADVATRFVVREGLVARVRRG